MRLTFQQTCNKFLKKLYFLLSCTVLYTAYSVYMLGFFLFIFFAVASICFQMLFWLFYIKIQKWREGKRSALSSGKHGRDSSKIFTCGQQCKKGLTSLNLFSTFLFHSFFLWDPSPFFVLFLIPLQNPRRHIWRQTLSWNITIKVQCIE